MESLQIRTGAISLQILDDAGNERGIFKFNPEDIESAKAIIELQDQLQEKELELQEKCDNATTEKEKVEALYEIVEYFEGLIDTCFGAGSSELLFGDAKSLSMFYDFFEGIIPYYEKASAKRMAKYSKGTSKSKK